MFFRRRTMFRRFWISGRSDWKGLEGSIVDGLKKKGAPNLELLPAGTRLSCWWNLDPDDPDEANHLARQLIDQLRRSADPPDIRLYTKSEARLVWKIARVRSRARLPPRPALRPNGRDGTMRLSRRKSWAATCAISASCSTNTITTRRFYGHFGHGCIHMRVSFDLESENGIRKYGEFVERAADLVVSYGGSLSGEHGDGQSRGALLPKMFGPELMKAFVEFKSAWDPDNKMNPNKVVNAHLPTENLRLGADYKPHRVPTLIFSFPMMADPLPRRRCGASGSGECRKHDGGSMCPSYMVTLEEEHSTRGRAHMLFELLQGEVVRDGWKDEHVKKALDLCLSCKACKSECPTNVDIATYKAEFLSHYYEGREPASARLCVRHDRPLGDDSDRWRPVLANFVSQAPGFRHLLQSVLHLAPQRRVPRLARSTFQHWARKHRVPSSGGEAEPESAAAPNKREVILWADTFNNYFCPETSRAALEVLQDAGFKVSVPQIHLAAGGLCTISACSIRPRSTCNES